MTGWDVPFARSQQDQSRRTVLAELQATPRHAHGSRWAEEKARGFFQALAEHERAHPDFVGLHFRSAAAFGFLLVILVSVWWVDFLLFSATAEYFAGRVFYRWLWLIPVVCFFSPAVLLVIEIGIGLQRDLARDEGGLRSRLSVWGWTAVGVLLALVVPLAAVATTLAMQPSVSDPDAAASLRMQTAALAVLAFAGHLLVLFGGRHAHNAKAFAAFKLHQWLLRRKGQMHDRRARTMGEAAVAAFESYYHERQLHNAAFPGARLEFGPFDALTRALINEHFGYEFITLKTAPKSERRDGPPPNGHRRGPEDAKSQHPARPQDLAAGSSSLPAGATNGHSRRRRWRMRQRAR